MRPSSLTDQLYIKAKRLRSIEEKGRQEIAEEAHLEYLALYNYSLLAILQLRAPQNWPIELEEETLRQAYAQVAKEVEALMLKKNHDYGEAWRDMRLRSITDLILMKIHRVKQIEDLGGQLLVSEGLEANYQDIANYAIFALILSNENRP